MRKLGIFAVATAAVLFYAPAFAANPRSSDAVQLKPANNWQALQGSPYAEFGPLGLPAAVVGTGLGVLTGGAFGGYGAYGYSPGYGYNPAYGYPSAAPYSSPMMYRTPAMAQGGMGQYCATPVKTCELYSPAQIGGGCSCRVEGGRARGSVAP